MTIGKSREWDRSDWLNATRSKSVSQLAGSGASPTADLVLAQGGAQFYAADNSDAAAFWGGDPMKIQLYS